jgi:hypothetical protein
MVFGEAQTLSFFEFQYLSGWMYFYLIFVGFVLGILAFIFNSILIGVIDRFSQVSISRRLLLAGAITATIGCVFPQAMGADLSHTYSLVEDHSQSLLLIGLLIGKFALAMVALGLGVPGGLIGPIYVLGMISGGLLLLPLNGWIDTQGFTSTFSLLGMAGLLTATIHAPMSALSAVMEMSFNPGIILPAMLVIAPAYVTSTQLLGNKSILIRQLDQLRLPYKVSSVQQSLQKIGVLAAMETDFSQVQNANQQQLEYARQNSDCKHLILQKVYEADVDYALVECDLSLDRDAKPLQFFDMQGVPVQSTLAEVWEVLQHKRQGAVFVYEDDPTHLMGIVTWQKVRSYLYQNEF